MAQESLRQIIFQRFSALSAIARWFIAIITISIGAVVLFYLFNQVIYFFVARSYAEEISDAYDLNKWFTKALILLSFALIVFFAGYAFSFSKTKRVIGSTGLLILLISHSLLIGRIDRNFERKGQAVKCYVLLRETVKILNHVGTDPESGRECRPLTPEMVEKINLYSQGIRPREIISGDATFFDPLSGEPVAWYAHNAAGALELFDLMGFHPTTGDELKPVNRQIVDAWKAENAKKIRHVPQSKDPANTPFFNPTTGEAALWYWRNDASEYEFYDGPGYHPATGDLLRPVTKEVVAAWRQALGDADTKRRQERERQEAELRKRAEAEQRALEERAERERMAEQTAAEALQRQQQAAKDCDFLAANPTDTRRNGVGAPFDVLQSQAEQAIGACQSAVEAYPTELRFQYQLARASQFRNKKRAFDILTPLTIARYPAAFDNLGALYLERKDISGAIKLFRTGASLGDADSMVSLADLAVRGYFGQPNPEQTRWALLAKAAELGHAGAQRAMEEERSRQERLAVEEANQREAAKAAAAVFGTILQGVGRR